MKVNEVFYKKGILGQEKKWWVLTLLSTPYHRVDEYNYPKFFHRKIAQSKFKMAYNKYTKCLELRNPIHMELTCKEVKRIARSAVIELPNGIVLIISVGLNKDLRVYAPLYSGEIFKIRTLVFSIPTE